jgi:hypothetical protein
MKQGIQQPKAKKSAKVRSSSKKAMTSYKTAISRAGKALAQDVVVLQTPKTANPYAVSTDVTRAVMKRIGLWDNTGKLSKTFR